MAITQIRTLTVFVSDQDRAKAFYADLLGFEVRSDQVVGDNRWLEVVPRQGASAIALHRPFPGASPGTSRGIILQTDDLDADCAALTDAGVAVDGPNDLPWGRQATFADPDGNGFVLSAR
ncbi:VOC family protein [Pseudonocardia sichuanensis]|uniref:Putative enzyme related to lactoylglutathione lyase n=1 Tax=Pseudonocardia kunmingensis TaxID=630975 RepID=A0A543E240_9PSEU|nr:VOC family protein [Pseudonocardia kunmingensis]TQM15661.1 putative enzyme related to lactoylglutathione lyase [Pseudonocardia kunmingensis]